MVSTNQEFCSSKKMKTRSGDKLRSVPSCANTSFVSCRDLFLENKEVPQQYGYGYQSVVRPW
jgi:hypothetical protein